MKKIGVFQTHRGERVAGVRYEHTGLPDGAVAHRNTLYEPRCTHLQGRSPRIPQKDCLFALPLLVESQHRLASTTAHQKDTRKAHIRQSRKRLLIEGKKGKKKEDKRSTMRCRVGKFNSSSFLFFLPREIDWEGRHLWVKVVGVGGDALTEKCCGWSASRQRRRFKNNISIDRRKWTDSKDYYYFKDFISPRKFEKFN